MKTEKIKEILLGRIDKLTDTEKEWVLKKTIIGIIHISLNMWIKTILIACGIVFGFTLPLANTIFATNH